MPGTPGGSGRHPGRASVVAVAEPDEARRARLAAEHGIAARDATPDWRQLAGRERFADAVLICTQDRLHAEPAEAFAALGYHILLEKPMAPDEAGCRRIVAAVEEAGANADGHAGHGGGDAGLMDAFTAAVATGDRTLIKSGPRESLASHLAVLAARFADVSCPTYNAR